MKGKPTDQLSPGAIDGHQFVMMPPRQTTMNVRSLDVVSESQVASVFLSGIRSNPGVIYRSVSISMIRSDLVMNLVSMWDWTRVI